MIVWLFTVGEPLPTDVGGQRLLRTGHLARKLSQLGVEVVWWTSSFDHVRKSFRSDGDASLNPWPKVEIRLLDSPGYARNVSLARIRDHLSLAWRLRGLIRAEQTRPDLMMASLPTPEIAAVVTDFGRGAGIPTVVDVRDWWPDVFEAAFPPGARALARPLLAPFRALSRRACAGATAITGHAPAFVDWGLEMGRRDRSPLDRDFPHGYFDAESDPAAESKARDYWESRGILAGQFIICFFGAVGHQFQLSTAFDAARQLRDIPDLRFVVCGDGDRLSEFREDTADLGNVVLPGWIDQPHIAALMKMSSLGLAPYVDRADYRMTIPNKVPEYLSGGLPILLSLSEGTLADFLRDSGTGVLYGNSAPELAANIRRLHSRSEELLDMATRARELFESHFEGDMVYSRFATHLTLIASEHGKSR